MPIALRPGTTATRAERALIERAMSSARPMTRDDLVPGAGSSSYSGTTGPGLAVMIWPGTPGPVGTDLVAHAELPQHGFRRRGAVLARFRARLETLGRRRQCAQRPVGNL